MNDRGFITHEGGSSTVSFNLIVNKSELDLYREVGGKHQVTITVLKDEGDVYGLDFDDNRGGIVHGRFTVGPRQVYAHLGSPKLDIGGFWQELGEREAEQSEGRS